MSKKIKKKEEKYRAKQQLANKFTQKSPSWFGDFSFEKKDKKAVRKLADNICK